MKPPAFEYHRPDTVEEAVALLADLGPDARILAGGQSLIPVLNFRLSSPTALVDLNGVSELDFVETSPGGGVRLGAMTRQRAAERSSLVSERAPLLAEALPWVAHVAIRNRGTVGGSLAHADPAAELPAVMLALDAQIRTVGPDGERGIEARAFFPGFFSTDLAPGEVLCEILVPPPPPRTGFAFEEVARRHGDFALAGVAARVTLDGSGAVDRVRLGLLGVGPGPILSPSAEPALKGGPPSVEAFGEAARAVAAQDVSPLDDVHASADYRRALVRTLTVRALTTAAARAGGQDIPDS